MLSPLSKSQKPTPRDSPPHERQSPTEISVSSFETINKRQYHFLLTDANSEYPCRESHILQDRVRAQ